MHRGPWLQAGWFSISMYYHGTGVANTFNVKSIAHGIQQIETRKVYGEVGKSLALKKNVKSPLKASCARGAGIKSTNWHGDAKFLRANVTHCHSAFWISVER